MDCDYSMFMVLKDAKNLSFEEVENSKKLVIRGVEVRIIALE